MKVTQRVFHYYARYLAHPSGVTDSINHWAQASIDAGDEVRILAAPAAGSGSNEFSLTSVTRVIKHWGRGRGTWVPVGLFSLIRKNDLLVLHEGWVISNAFATLVALLLRAKVIVVPHGVYESAIVENQRDLFGARSLLERWVIRQAAAVHVFYRGERDVVASFEPKVTSYIVAPNGADEPGSGARWRGGGNYFLWMGRFDVFHKGLDNLLAYWAQLPSPRPELRLVGPDFLGGRAAVASLVLELGLEDVVSISGRVSGQEKEDLLAECRAYIHPSRWESCSIMLLEALAAGVPSLISSTIHAAGELEPLGVLKSTLFTGQQSSETLSRTDSNSMLGNAARDWSRHSGSWREVGKQMIQQQIDLGLRNKGVSS
jgi:glycosyltransferase involved in cell wall biosynthesis